MKSLVIGRKNWLFSTSQAGAKATAIWMSIIESAKANDINLVRLNSISARNDSKTTNFCEWDMVDGLFAMELQKHDYQADTGSVSQKQMWRPQKTRTPHFLHFKTGCLRFCSW